MNYLQNFDEIVKVQFETIKLKASKFHWKILLGIINKTSTHNITRSNNTDFGNKLKLKSQRMEHVNY